VAQLQAPLAQARAQGDQEAYYKTQERLFGAWVEACPNAIPPRAKEEGFRQKYIAYMARAYTLAAFDKEAEKHQAAVNQAVAGLQWTQTTEGGYRVGAAGWEKLIAALFPQQQYLEELYKREGIYAQQPDGAGDEVQRRINYSLFVQGWLPMITEEQAQALLARTNLAGEYMAVPSDRDLHPVACVQCGTTLELPAGAKKTVCEFCGHVLAVEAPTVSCPGCQAALTPTLDGTAVNCPYCGTEIKRVN
jgi:DNA-directed RNA polymerase subunit RPC12/RpoP